MSISLEKIFSNLKDYHPEIIISSNSDMEINDVVILKDDSLSAQDFKDSILYLINASDILKKIPDIFPHNLLCLCDILSFKVKILPEICSIILIKDKADIQEIFNSIDKQIRYNDRIMQVSTRLLDLAVENSGIQYIVSNCFHLFGNPMIITDTTFKVLAHTKVAIDDSLWDDIIQRGHGSYERYKIIQEFKLDNKSYNDDSCVKIKFDYSKYRILAANIISHGNIIGHIAMLEYSKPFEDCDEELLIMLCKIMAAEMEKDIHYNRTKGIMYEYFIQDLIDGKIKNEVIVRDKMNYMDLKLKKYIFLLKITFKSGYNDEYNLWQLRGLLESIAGIGQSLIYRDCILFIISRDSNTALSNEERLIISGFLSKYKMVGGLSRYFFSIAETKDHYEQSTIAIEIGNLLDKNKNLYTYEEYSIHHITEILVADANMISMCHPAIEELNKFDKKNKTNYCKTLHAYLSSNCNMLKTAKVLFVHTSTVKYRINKIKDILKLNIHDLNNSLIFYLSLNMKEYDLKNSARLT